MIRELLGETIAIVGGGRFCKAFLEFIFSQEFDTVRPAIAGVADINPAAPGMQLARSRNIPTTSDYTEFFTLKKLDTILELTKNPALGIAVKRTKPDRVRLVDHFEIRGLLDHFEIEKTKQAALCDLQSRADENLTAQTLLERFSDHVAGILKKKDDRSREIEIKLMEQQQTLAQIIQGSTIPTFVIDERHKVTHWNKALEKMTGIKADSVVGTNRQWFPFWDKERPTMADVILDQTEEAEIRKLYGEKWRKSALIGGAFEAEAFFTNLGQTGKWLWFTASPIKAPDGTIIGAIETLWDKTEDKNAEHEREQHTRELATLCSVYSALNAPLPLDFKIKTALHDILNFIQADAVSIFLYEPGGAFVLKHSYPPRESRQVLEENSFVHQVAAAGEFIIIHNHICPDKSEFCLAEERIPRSLAYVPISTKVGQPFAVVRIENHLPHQFTKAQKPFMELVGNRIAVTIENAALQEQVAASEKKYRSLFNNNPNPIFLINGKTLQIIDTNQRAVECYGYSRAEMAALSFLDLGDDDDVEIKSGLHAISSEQFLFFAKKRHYKKNGRPFYVNINISQAKYGEQEILIASTSDITESVEKETQLIQAGKMTTLGVMAAGMAHEINQPLNVIQICADFFLKMLKKGKTISEDDIRTMASDIVDNVNRATGVIKHVRDFARQSDVVRHKVNLNDPIQDVFKVLGHQLKMHQIETRLELAPDLPCIMAEHNRLEQVFINLVSNAIDAMDEKAADAGNKTVVKQLVIRSFTRGGKVVAEVSDTGTGISEEVQDKIFEPFFTTKKIGKGTGLGVSISYGIVRDFEGAISIQSQVGQGTTFTISFPAFDPGPEP